MIRNAVLLSFAGVLAYGATHRISGAIAVVAVELVVWGAFRYRTRNRDFSAQ
jgi:hypothetical protein